MKRMQFLAATALVAVLVLALVSFAGCTGSDRSENPVQTGETTKPDAKAVKYTCSMHPEVVQDKPGDCPKCGMKLVEKP